MLYKSGRLPINNGISEGNTVGIIYQATLPDGRVFATNSGQATTITIGSGEIPGIDKNLVGAKSGDILTFSVPANESYGKFYDPNRVQKVPVYALQELPINAETGTTIVFGTQISYIKSVGNNMVTLDANPLHTRQDLEYTVTITTVEKHQ